MQSLIACPEGRSRSELRGCEQVSIDIADTDAKELTAGDEGKDLVVIRDESLCELSDIEEEVAPVPDASHRQFTDHEGVDQNEILVEQVIEGRIAFAKVIDPD